MERRKQLRRRQALTHRFTGRVPSDVIGEMKLWSLLRANPIAGLRFLRRQVIGPYVVDFYCPAAKLIIELDGDQYGADEGMEHDAIRTNWLTSQGCRILRFPNWQVLKNPQNILDEIARTFEIRSVPLPETRSASFDPPSRGR